MDTPNGASLDISAVSWPDIFSRHEMNLRSHGELCVMLKQHVVPDSLASEGLMNIIRKTQELLEELGRLRLEFTNHGIAGRVLSGQNVNRVDELRQRAADEARGNPSANTNSSNNTHNFAPNSQNPPVFVFDTKPTPTSMPQRPKNTRKRFFDDDEPNRNGTKKENLFTSSKKSKKDDIPEPAPEQPQGQQTSNPQQSQPIVEFEDISDEVERRLKLREERRRKRYLPPQKKRKRESGGSVVNEEIAAPKPKRHRSNGNQEESENIAPSWGKDKRKISAETSEVEGRNRSHNRKKTKRSKGGQV